MFFSSWRTEHTSHTNHTPTYSYIHLLLITYYVASNFEEPSTTKCTNCLRPEGPRAEHTGFEVNVVLPSTAVSHGGPIPGATLVKGEAGQPNLSIFIL